MSLYAANASINVTVVDGTVRTGLHAADGSLNVFDATNTSTFVGAYHPCGALNVSIRDGTSYVGAYAPNGSWNVCETDTGSGARFVTIVAGGEEPDPEPEPSDYAWESAVSDDTTGTEFTLGYTTFAEATDYFRLVAVSVIADSGSAPTLSVTIDGVAAASVGTAASQTASGATNHTEFFLADGTVNLSFDVVVTSNVSCFSCYSSLWTLISPGEVLDSGTDAAGDGSPLTPNLDVAEGGMAFAAALGYQGATNPTATWTGLTEDVDGVFVFTDENFTAASAKTNTTETLSVTCTWDGMNGAVQAQTAASVSFAAPEGGGGEPGPNLPLLEWEGGSSYYAQFPKANAAGWSATSFFPIGLWLSPGQDPHPTNAATAGVTHYMATEANAGNITNIVSEPLGVWPQMAEWDDAEVDGEAGSSDQCCAWMVDDEPDMNEAYGDQFGRLAEVESRVATATGYADGRFTGLNIGNGVNKTFWSPDTVEDMVRAVDVCGVDQYCYSASVVRNNVINSPDWIGPGADESEARCAAAYGWLADQMRSFQDPNDRKPFYVTVETAKPLIAEDDPWITIPEIEGAIWAAIIHEARGIMLFQHNNNWDGFGGTDPFYSLTDDASTTIRDGVAAITAKVRSLAPIIMGVQTSIWDFDAAGIDTMLKLDEDNGFAYIFAHVAFGGTTGSKTFTLPSGITGTSVEVVGESRSLTVTAGEFTDDFDEEYTHHVYKISI